MAYLVDIFGFLSVVLRGLVLALTAFSIGGIVFRHVVLSPTYAAHPNNIALSERLTALQRRCAWGVVVGTLCAMGLELSVLTSTIGVSWGSALTAPFAIAGMLVCVSGLLLATLTRPRNSSPWLEALAGATLLTGIVMTTHALGRIEGRSLMVTVSALHQAGAAAWIGGLPYFLIALSAALPLSARAAVAQRYSHVCVAAVLAVVISAAVKYFNYLGVFAATYGTAYGLMTSTKGVLFLALLCFGAGNYWAVRRMAGDDQAAQRTRRFVEVELVLGLTVFFVAGSLTSLPPAVDLPRDRVPWNMVVERVLTPREPRLVSPEYSELAYAKEQVRIDTLAIAEREEAAQSFAPGSGVQSPRTEGDIAWSEYNHNWSGVFVLSIGLLALIAKLPGGRWARHWPLLFIVLGIFVAIRSDPETWPLGGIGFVESFLDPSVVQHRFAAALVALFGLFEWRVRTSRLTAPWASNIFPITNIVGGVLLLTHSHSLENIQEALLIEMSHIPLGLFAIASGCARWLELRCSSPIRERAGWVWPICFAMIGVVLLFYRES